MTFAAVLDSRDDADILPATIEQLRSIGVDLVTVLDHGLTDGTLQYLSEAEAAGDIWLIRPALDGPRTDRIDRLRVALAAASDADWVLFAEAGDLWLPASGSLSDLSGLDETDVLDVPRYLVVVGPDGLMMPDRLGVETYDQTYLYCQPRADIRTQMDEYPLAAWTSGLLAPGRMARPAALARRAAASTGDDGASTDRRRITASDLVVAYAPFGTFEQFTRRAARVWHAMTAGRDASEPGASPASLAHLAPTDGMGLREDHERQLLTRGQLESLRRRDVVRSVLELLERPIPAFATEGAYMAAVNAAEPWLSAAARVCRLEDIRPRGPLTHLATFNRPSVVMPPDHLVKFYSTWRDGLAVVERELAAYELLSRDPRLPVPRPVGHGTLDEDWRYLVVDWLPGRPLSAVSDQLGAKARARVATWLGRFVRQLHAIPLSQEERDEGCLAFSAEVRRRHANARARADGGGLPPRLASQVFDWLPPLDAMLPAPEEMVLTHADLKDDHILGTRSSRSFAPTGVIDFGEARIAHPMYDLPVIWWSALGKDRDLVARFLQHARIPGVDEEGFPRMALAWAVVHPSWEAVTLTGVEDARDLDDLAVRLFGPRSQAAESTVDADPPWSDT